MELRLASLAPGKLGCRRLPLGTARAGAVLGALAPAPGGVSVWMRTLRSQSSFAAARLPPDSSISSAKSRSAAQPGEPKEACGDIEKDCCTLIFPTREYRVFTLPYILHTTRAATLKMDSSPS